MPIKFDATNAAVAVVSVTVLLILDSGLAAPSHIAKSAAWRPLSQRVPSTSPQSAPPIFEDVAARVGLTVSHVASPDKKYIVESMSGGVGLIDCDNDGRLDIVVVNGSTVERFRRGGDPMVTLYHQGADGKFVDITKQAGLSRLGWGMGVAVADFDNDGMLDLYVTGFGGNALYRNLGDCKFEDVTEKAGVSAGGFSTGAVWAITTATDMWTYSSPAMFTWISTIFLNSAKANTAFSRAYPCNADLGEWWEKSDLLYHNRGEGTFEELSKKAGVNDPAGRYGLGAIWADYANDGWPDLFVANDAGPNYLYRNNHDGTFTDVAMTAGAALSGAGQAQGNMGVDFGDYDHRSLFDIFVTTFADQPNTLYRNVGSQGFDDASWTSKLGQPSYPLVGWGTGFFDMDNDGWLDVFVANGHVYPQMDSAVNSAPYRQAMLLHRNNRNGTFEEVSAQAELTKLPAQSRRGSAFGDIFNTGNIDIVVLNVGQPPSLLLNTLRGGNHRVLFKLEGTQSNKAAIGARLTVQAGGLRQFSEVRGGSSYLSQNDQRLHFALGSESQLDVVEVRWPNGKVQTLHNLAADRIYQIAEEKGIRQCRPYVMPP